MWYRLEWGWDGGSRKVSGEAGAGRVTEDKAAAVRKGAAQGRHWLGNTVHEPRSARKDVNFCPPSPGALPTAEP